MCSDTKATSKNTEYTYIQCHSQTGGAMPRVCLPRAQSFTISYFGFRFTNVYN